MEVARKRAMTATMGRRKMFDTDIFVGFEKYWLLALYWLTIYFVSTNRRDQGGGGNFVSISPLVER